MEATDDEWFFSDWYGQAAPQEVARGQRESVLGVELVEDDAYSRPTMSLITAALAQRMDPLRRNSCDPSRNKQCRSPVEGRSCIGDTVRSVPLVDHPTVAGAVRCCPVTLVGCAVKSTATGSGARTATVLPPSRLSLLISRRSGRGGGTRHCVTLH